MAKVLCVDDNVLFADLIATMLDMLGHQAITAHNGEDALKLLDTEKPDLICADMNMPGMSGEELVSRIRADPLMSDLPIIAITAVPKDRQYFLERGCDAYIAKPLNLRQLREVVRDVLDQQQ